MEEQDFSELEYLYDTQIHTEDGHAFPVHRILLAIQSNYFHRLLCIEGVEDTNILVPHIRGAIMDIIVDYINTKNIRSSAESDAPDIISAAFFLGVEDLFQNRRSVALRNLTTTNCIPLLLTAVHIRDWDLAKACARFVVVHFERVLQDQDSGFQDISLEMLEGFLASDSLNVSHERTVWFAIDLWVRKDLEKRKMHVTDLLPYVRFPTAENALATTVLNSSLVQDNPCFSHIKGVIDHRGCPFKHRIPGEVFFVTKSFVHFLDYTEGIKVFITYDEDMDFWRNVGTKAAFAPNFVLHGSGPLVVLFDTIMNVSFTFNVVSKMWAPMTPPTVARSEYSVIKLGAFLYALGGLIPGDDFAVSTAVERYSFVSGVWESTQPHSAISQGAAVAINNSICVIGTMSGFFSETILAQCFNPVTETWTAFSPPNTYRRLFAFVAYKNQLFVIGGHSSVGFLKSVEVYDAKRNMWSEFEALPFSYFLPKAVVIKGVLYVYDNHGDAIQDFRFPPVRWDEFSRQWQVVEASSPFCDLHLYEFCTLDDPEVIIEMRNENRHPLTEWKVSPFLKYE